MAATVNLPRGVPAFNSQAGCLSSAKKISEFFFQCRLRRTSQRVDLYRSTKISNSCSSYGNRESNAMAAAFSPNGVALPSTDDGLMLTRINVNAQRKTKIVCTIGPSTSSRDMIWKLAEAGMNVARLNMSHGDHASHQKTIDLVKEYNAQFQEKVVAIMLDTKGPEVRSGDVPQPILLKEGQEFNFTIKRGVSTADTVSVNYDDFINDVEVGDILLVDGE